MSFSFLNPWFWLGALAVAFPIWLHLHRKQVSNLYRFSTLRFLDDEPSPQRSPLRLRDLLLLLTRLLALLLIIAAFAWPFIPDPNAVVIQESRVYILDNSLSHQTDGGFARDRERILDDIRNAAQDVQIAVIELTSQPDVAVTFGDSRESALSKVSQLDPSFERGSYLAAFRTAHALLENSLGKQKRIILCGDNQENQWTENINTPPFLFDVDVQLPGTTAGAHPNLALSDPRLQRVFLSDKSLVNFTAKLTHINSARSARVALRIHRHPEASASSAADQITEQVIFDESVDLAGQPETMLIQAQWESHPSEAVTGEIEIEGTPDALPGDNRAYFVLPALVPGNVALLARSRYLQAALSPDVMRGQWILRPIDPTRAGDELNGEPKSDVLCIESSYLQSSDIRKLVWHYHSNGRGVLLLVDTLTPVVSGFLRELGFETGALIERPASKPAQVQFVAFTHPIFHPFLAPEYGDLLDITVKRYAKLTSNEAVPLMYSDDGEPLLFQSTRSHGKLFVAAFPFDRDVTSWPIHQTFVPFLDLALQSARADDPVPVNFEPGIAAAFPIPQHSNSVSMILSDDSSRELARVDSENGIAKLSIPKTPGIYTISYDNQPNAKNLFAVNPSSKESELITIAEPEPVKLWTRTTGAAAKAEASSPAASTDLGDILRQYWWWWLLVVAAAALLIETALVAIKRQTV